MTSTDKYLCNCGLGSRTDVKHILKKKKVLINDIIVVDPGFQVTETDIVCIDGEILKYNEFHYYILNKPSGVVTAREDNYSKTVMDLLDLKYKDLSPVGRLDKDTEGLLLITDNGKLAHNMLSPKKHVNKTYLVHLEKDIDDCHINILENGVDIKEDKLTLPAKVKRIDSNKIELTIHEGKYHQVKRMMEAVDNHVIFLKRLVFGPLKLDENLLLGQYRELSSDEMKLLNEYM